MSFLKRLLRPDPLGQEQEATQHPPWMRNGMTVSLFEGSEVLEVKGESYYQDELGQVVKSEGREVAAILAPEPDNPYDPNAIAVWVVGLKVGHLSREDAAIYQPAITRLMKDEGQPIAVTGRIFGGGPDKPSLGVWLYHDPADFGLASTPSSGETSLEGGGLRTGTAAGSLHWLDELPTDRVAAIKQLRKLLAAESDPIERHFMYLELEKLLYKCRDVFESALAEFEATCLQHDSEMETIIPRLKEEIGGIPGLPTYKQAAIMQQKAHDFEGALWWAERGLALYGDETLRPDYVEDLQKRVDKYRKKLEGPATSNKQKPGLGEL